MLQNKQYFIELKEFAEFIGRNPRSIQNIISSKKEADNGRKKQIPPFKKIAGKHVVTVKDFERWLNSLPAENAPVAPQGRRGRPRKNTTK